MKTFIYLYSETKVPADGSGRKKTVRLWRVKNNKPELLGDHTEAFVGEFQLVMHALERFNALPKRAFARSEASSGYVYRSAAALEAAGLATVISL